GGGGKGSLRYTPVGGRRDGPDGFRHLGGNRFVIGGRRDNGNIVKILRRRANHRRPADINVLDQFFELHAGLGGSLLKRVQINDDHVNRRDAVFGNRRAM